METNLNNKERILPASKFHIGQYVTVPCDYGKMEGFIDTIRYCEYTINNDIVSEYEYRIVDDLWRNLNWATSADRHAAWFDENYLLTFCRIK